MSITKVNILKNFVTEKKLNAKNGGPIKIKDINLNELDKCKKIINDFLYPS